MKRYQTFSAQDFASDEDFLRWVKYPEHDPFLDKFWQNWLLENPDKREAVDDARCMILAVLHEKQSLPAEGAERDIWARIEQSTGMGQRSRSLWRPWYARAAVVLMFASAGWLALKSDPTAEGEVAVEQKAEVTFVTQLNNSETPKTVILSDGTSIIMQPRSALEYPVSFEDDKREVFLTGQAFFEVVRDADRPFLVHAGEIVTRVLGTSFTVRNVEGEKKVLVKVKTGKVSVFVASNEEKAPGGTESVYDKAPGANKSVEGVVLMPNQQVVFERQHMRMTKSLIENPAVLNPLAKREFEFVDAPIKDVFLAIENAYGIDIVFDEETLSTCFLNASLTDVPLYEKLKLICMGINTTYEIIDSHIIIYGSGCDEDITKAQTQTIVPMKTPE